MSDRRTAVLKVVFAVIAVAYALLKVAYTLLLAFLLWFGIYLLAGTECEEPDCSWLADNVFTGDRSAYLLVVCLLVAVGLVWAIPLARRKRSSHRPQD
jgi:predicted neutral ceramidase superfamily lipid hydrolase